MHISNEIDRRIAESGATKSLFSTVDHITPNYVRSSTCWAHDLDLSCASPWNSDGGDQKAGVLISPRHILFANHFAIVLGSTLRFVGMDNSVVERTLTASQIAYTDVVVGLLDSDILSGVTFAMMLPASVETLIQTGTPKFFLDQEHKAIINGIFVATSDWGSSEPPTPASRAAFYEPAVAGDSGQPNFVPINGQAVLLGLAAASGGALHKHLDTINATMTTLGGGHQVTTIDLSEFE